MSADSQPRPIPRWREIEGELERRIEAGDYADGFPGELELAHEFQVSRGTMRNALRRLRESGRVTASRGRRPRITATSMSSTWGAIYSLYEIVTASGARQRSTVLQQRILDDPAVGTRLRLDEASAPLFHLARVRWADTVPIAVDEIWIPADVGAPLLEVDFGDTAFYKELRDVCGVTVAGGSEEISAALADERTAELLDCSPGDPLLSIERLAHDGERRIELRRTLIVGSRYTATRPFGTHLADE